MANKQSRIDELQVAIDEAERDGYISAAVAHRIRGRFIFARSNLFAKCGAPALLALGAVADGRARRVGAATAAVAALHALRETLVSAGPRVITARLPGPSSSSDGACEPIDGRPVASMGAVIFRAGRKPECFGTKIDPALVESWSATGGSQVIGQAELLPILIAITTWAQWLTDTPTICFIDNESAKHAMVAGYSPIHSSSAIIGEATAAMCRIGCRTWFSRVPSASNPADGPSRLDFDFVKGSLGATTVDPSFYGAVGQDMWHALLRRLEGE